MNPCIGQQCVRREMEAFHRFAGLRQSSGIVRTKTRTFKISDRISINQTPADRAVRCQQYVIHHVRPNQVRPQADDVRRFDRLFDMNRKKIDLIGRHSPAEKVLKIAKFRRIRIRTSHNPSRRIPIAQHQTGPARPISPGDHFRYLVHRRQVGRRLRKGTFAITHRKDRAETMNRGGSLEYCLSCPIRSFAAGTSFTIGVTRISRGMAAHKPTGALNGPSTPLAYAGVVRMKVPAPR